MDVRVACHCPSSLARVELGCRLSCALAGPVALRCTLVSGLTRAVARGCALPSALLAHTPVRRGCVLRSAAHDPAPDLVPLPTVSIGGR